MSAELLARGATPWYARGAPNSTRERAQVPARVATPASPPVLGNNRDDPSGRPAGGRRIRDEARDGLSAAAISLGGSMGVTGVLWLVLRWLG